MGYRDFFGTLALPSEIPLSREESARFGLTFGRLLVPVEHANVDVESVTALTDRSALDIVVLRYPAEWVRWSSRLLRSERDALHADTLVYWRLPLEQGVPAPALEPRFGVRALAGFGDSAPALLHDLVADLFAGYGNHYLANPLLDPVRALAGYQEWARRALEQNGQQDALVLTDDMQRPVALATTEYDGDTSEVLLAGVVAAHRGEGLYQHLLRAVEVAARARRCAELVISTQVHNSIVQRAWASYGFRPVFSLDTFHLVRRGLL